METALNGEPGSAQHQVDIAVIGLREYSLSMAFEGVNSDADVLVQQSISRGNMQAMLTVANGSFC